MLNNFLRRVTGRPLLVVDMQRSKIRSAVERYLDSRPYTLFANWDLSHPDRQEQAVHWLTEQVVAVLDEMGGNHE